MNTYGIFDGDDLVSTCDAESQEYAPPGAVLLENWTGWPSPRPAGQRALRATVGGWAWVDTRDLAQAKAEQWAAIKAVREARIAEPKATPHGAFDGSPADQDNLNKVIALLRVAISRGADDQANYTLADNTRGTFTLAQLEDAALAVGSATQALYDTSATLRAQIEEAATVAEVDAIAWPA